jgi:Holliday junction resolvase RusA-like endonuclease
MPITQQAYEIMRRRTERNRRVIADPAPAPAPEPAPEPTNAWPWPALPPCHFTVHEFDYLGDPVGKPRMTQRDRWQKRPCVLRYRAFADALREAAGSPPPNPDMVMVDAHIAMPASWSDKKKRAMAGKPCRSTPDHDNISKACCDVLFKQDAGIWLGLTVKFWAFLPSLHVKILYVQPE